MTVRIKKPLPGATTLKTIVEDSTGADLSVCLQCGKCTNGCPVAESVEAGPAELLRRLHLGLEADDILPCDIVQLCLSCGTCVARCPMEIDIPRIIDALRVIAGERGAVKTEGNIPLFNRAFLETVRLFGRTYDMGMIGAYKLGTLKLLQDTGKFPAMLKKGKIALVPSTDADRRTVRRIYRITNRKKTGGT